MVSLLSLLARHAPVPAAPPRQIQHHDHHLVEALLAVGTAVVSPISSLPPHPPLLHLPPFSSFAPSRQARIPYREIQAISTLPGPVQHTQTSLLRDNSLSVPALLHEELSLSASGAPGLARESSSHFLRRAPKMADSSRAAALQMALRPGGGGGGGGGKATKAELAGDELPTPIKTPTRKRTPHTPSYEGEK